MRAGACEKVFCGVFSFICVVERKPLHYYGLTTIPWTATLR